MSSVGRPSRLGRAGGTPSRPVGDKGFRFVESGIELSGRGGRAMRLVGVCCKFSGFEVCTGAVRGLYNVDLEKAGIEEGASRFAVITVLTFEGVVVLALIVLATGCGVRGLCPLLDESLSGGVGGGISRLDFFLATVSASLFTAIFSAGETDAEDGCDSRTADSPESSSTSSVLEATARFLRVTGGRVFAGLIAGRILGPNFGVCMRLGECDEADVGVEPRLKLPGELEKRVDGVLLRPNEFDGGGSGVVSFGSCLRAL